MTWPLAIVAPALLFLACTRGEQTRSDSARFAKRGNGRPTSAPASTNRYALLVGIGVYPAPEDSLPGPSTDVEEMKDVLVHRLGFSSSNVVTLVDRAATRDAIIAAIHNTLARADSQGTIVFYFSGHGIRLRQNLSIADPEQTGVDQALKVWDTSGKATLLLDDELGVLFHKVPASHHLVIVDACFSGSIMTVTMAKQRDAVYARVAAAEESSRVKSAPPRPLFFEKDSYVPASSDPGFVYPARYESDGQPVSGNEGAGPLDEVDDHLLISAAQDFRESYGAQNWPTAGESHGLFTYYFSRALAMAPASQRMNSLVASVRAALANGQACRRLLKCQDPQIGGRDSALTIANFQ